MAFNVSVLSGVVAIILINIRSVFCLNETTIVPITASVAIANSTEQEEEHPILNVNSSSLIQSLDGESDDEDDTGKLAGIIIACLIAALLVAAVIMLAAYRYLHRKGRTSLNFDNPVYRKTTEDQFSLEKNQYHPAHSYPSSLEPLTSPGTNEFV